jgi:hypothetical protein
MGKNAVAELEALRFAGSMVGYATFMLRSCYPTLKAVSQLLWLVKIARSGFPWEKTTERSLASLYANCETAVGNLLRSLTGTLQHCQLHACGCGFASTDLQLSFFL